MLINPASFLDEPQLVWGIAAIGIFGKLLLVTAFAIAFGYSRKAALTAGLALANMGEFSFVLAAEGVKEGIFDADQNGAVLAAVLISIASSPLLLLAREPILNGIRSLPVLGPMMKDPMEVHLFAEGELTEPRHCVWVRSGWPGVRRRSQAEGLSLRGDRSGPGSH